MKERAARDARSAEEVATQKLEQARRYLDAERTHRVQAERGARNCPGAAPGAGTWRSDADSASASTSAAASAASTTSAAASAAALAAGRIKQKKRRASVADAPEVVKADGKIRGCWLDGAGDLVVATNRGAVGVLQRRRDGARTDVFKPFFLSSARGSDDGSRCECADFRKCDETVLLGYDNGVLEKVKGREADRPCPSAAASRRASPRWRGAPAPPTTGRRRWRRRRSRRARRRHRRSRRRTHESASRAHFEDCRALRR